MSQLQVDSIKNRAGTGAPSFPNGATVTGVITATTFSGNITGAAATFTGNVSIGGTLTYEDVTNVDSVGLVTARSGVIVGTSATTGTASQGLQVQSGAYISGNVGLGTTNPKAPLHIVGGEARLNGVLENVAAATTYTSGGALVLEMDIRQATTYTYTNVGGNIGIVSFKNLPADAQGGTTVTLIHTQNATTPSGIGNTTAATGIGTNCTVIPYVAGAAIAGISTRGLVGSATTTTLSTTASDVDFVSFFVHYNGGTNTAAASYKVYVTNNGNFRRGTIGV